MVRCGVPCVGLCVLLYVFMVGVGIAWCFVVCVCGVVCLRDGVYSIATSHAHVQ